MKIKAGTWGILLAALVVISQFPVTAFALEGEQTPAGLLVLGDSIAKGTGLAAGEKNFGDLLAASYGLSGPAYNNLAVDGLTSGDLAEAAAAGQFDALPPYDAIVISIGANDILGESIKIIMDSAGVPANTPHSALPVFIQMMPEETLDAAMVKIAADLRAYFTPEKIAQKAGDLHANLLSITDTIGAASAAAPPRVYVLTLYDPFSGVPGLETLSALLDPILAAMNNSIEATSAAGYTVVDIYPAFQGNAAALTNMARLFDPHPTALGQEVIAGKIEESRASSAPQPAAAAFVATADVNVRASASANAAAIGYIPRGAAVAVLDKTGGWYKVRFNGKTGYVSSQYVAEQGTMDITGATPKIVNTTALNVRSGAGASHSVVGVVKSGETVYVIETTGGWAKIVWYGGTAYVSGSYIKDMP